MEVEKNPFNEPHSTATIAETTSTSTQPSAPKEFLSRASKVALVILGICSATLIFGLLVRYYPVTSDVIFPIVSCGIALSAAFLIMKGIHEWRSRKSS